MKFLTNLGNVTKRFLAGCAVANLGLTPLSERESMYPPGGGRPGVGKEDRDMLSFCAIGKQYQVEWRTGQ